MAEFTRDWIFKNISQSTMDERQFSLSKCLDCQSCSWMQKATVRVVTEEGFSVLRTSTRFVGHCDFFATIQHDWSFTQDTRIEKNGKRTGLWGSLDERREGEKIDWSPVVQCERFEVRGE